MRIAAITYKAYAVFTIYNFVIANSNYGYKVHGQVDFHPKGTYLRPCYCPRCVATQCVQA